MKKFKLTALLFVVPLLLLGFLSIAWRASAKKVALHAKDLREHNLLVIAPTEPGFEQEVARIMGHKTAKQRQDLESLKPFSVIVKNESSKAVIAYALRWDITSVAGVTVSHVTSYAEPSTLLGREPNNKRDVGAAIAPRSMRYVSITAPVTESSQDGLISTSTVNPVATDSAGQIAQLGSAKNETALVDLLSAELASAESLTVSLDAAVFDDGTSVGPDTSGLFAQLKAEMEAQDDLLKDSLRAVERGKPVKEVFDDLATIANQQVAPFSEHPSPSDYYEFYKREFAHEATQMRAAMGDDKKALWTVTQPIRQPRYRLHRPATKKVNGDKPQH